MKYPNHLNYSDDDVEYKYRCLVYPNITFQKDFSKDSYYIIMANILKYLTKLRPDIYFTVLTPEIMPGFKYKNTIPLNDIHNLIKKEYYKTLKCSY